MEKKILEFYKQFSMYTFPGAYNERLKKDLPDNVEEIGYLMRTNTVHPTTLRDGNTGSNADKRFGDMTIMPWFRQREDDMLPTAAAMLAELYRRCEHGFVTPKPVEQKLVVSCRHVALLMAAILKAKGIPARVRAGHAPYFDYARKHQMSVDHWVNEYWSEREQRWVMIDVDGSFSLEKDINPYDLPAGTFDLPGQAWLKVRRGEINPKYFWNAAPKRGQIVLLWSLFYDFHSLMNAEIIYIHGPRLCAPKAFKNATASELQELDHLASLLIDSDFNFSTLQQIWQNTKDFRLLGGGLL